MQLLIKSLAAEVGGKLETGVKPNCGAECWIMLDNWRQVCYKFSCG